MPDSSLSARIQAAAPDFVRQGTIVASGATARPEKCIARCGDTFAKSSATFNTKRITADCSFPVDKAWRARPDSYLCDYDEDYDTAVAVELLPCKIPELR
jgi:hypothetical protein